MLATICQAREQPGLAHFQKGVELRDHGKQAEALKEFREAARVNSGLPFVHREVGLILLGQRDFAAAAEAFRRAARQDAADWESRYNLALSLANASREEEAIREIQSVLKARPDWGQAHFGLGHIYAGQRRGQEAEKAFRKAVSLDPTLFRAYFELGKHLEERGDRDGAIEAYSAGLRLSPDSSAVRFRLATLLRQSGRHAEAAREFASVRQISDARGRGEQAALAYQQGLALLKRGDSAGAVVEFKRGLELRPDFPELRSALAEAYEQEAIADEERGDPAAAVEKFRLALEMAPTAETANHVGVLLAKGGRLDEAIQSFRQALALQPGYPSAEMNLRQALELKKSAR